MGVPVVALTGERHAARVSASILTAAGLRELVADTADDYVAIARALAREPARIVALREGMRDQLLDSPLCDAQRVAQALEHAYLERWAHTGPFARLGAA
jgi:predicted O-linked N-acetylglucosamine transferase (SPINDLY family)